MDADFWHERWSSKRIAFHESEANRLLVKWSDTLGLQPGARVFVPLCGKTRDIAWFLSQGYRVVGIELSEIAVKELFEELGVTPAVTDAGPLDHYTAPDIDVFRGDFFTLSLEALGEVDAIYDRAALVALPEGMRERYAARLLDLTGAAPQLAICFEYDQAMMDGPPFSTDRHELERLYGAVYRMSSLEEGPVGGGLKSMSHATERAWLLEPSKPAS